MKRYEIIFSPYALEDLDTACDYYRQINQELEKKFLLVLDSKIKEIHTNPFFATIKFDEIRCASLKKFPYSIFYSIDTSTETVIINTIFFAKQKPFW